MDLVELERKLLAAGRKEHPSDKVPYAFQKRIMARLMSVQVEDAWSSWGRALWQGAMASVVLCAALGVWSASDTKLEVVTDLTDVYESTIYAAAEQMAEPW